MALNEFAEMNFEAEDFCTFAIVYLNGSEQPLEKEVQVREEAFGKESDGATIVETSVSLHLQNGATEIDLFPKHLPKHERTHDGKKPIVCSFCGAKFTRKFTLARHERIHTGEKPFECNFCDAKFSQRQHLRDHLKTHTGEKPFTCNVCGAKFARKSYLTNHERTHCEELSHICKYCSLKFSRRNALVIHERIHTDTKTILSGNGDVGVDGPSVGVKMSAEEETDFPEPVFLERKGRTHSPPSELCQSESPLISLEKVHTGSKASNGYICESSLPTKSSLEKNLRMDTGEKPFVCRLCGFAFNRKFSLARHEELHSGRKQFSCGFCDLKFAQRGNLVSHLRTHTGEKPYECTYCGAKFARRNDCANHEKLHLRQNSIQ